MLRVNNCLREFKVYISLEIVFKFIHQIIIVSAQADRLR